MFNTYWYNHLSKPTLAPPDWIFLPIWGVLYCTIFVSLLLYFFKGSNHKTVGYIYFYIQLIFNLLWVPVFFTLQNIPVSLIVIIGLNIFVFLTIKAFYKISKTSGLILIPYFIWVLFATYLNLEYFLLNYL